MGSEQNKRWRLGKAPLKKREMIPIEEMALGNLIMTGKKHEIEVKHLQNQKKILTS